ncbi:ATP-dependent RecD-like DNA helicase [Candidatus Arcanobacter lacustris]|uniref:ATP-dependent RecD-like DNA helicase n=1 Tax=Candidatus Arcanibacter lacustris TaxID=1607817 RepID=A0A0F5MQA3_9RICK|nr:ATP-dependent RecD-like DNA helicase [Candidatus Arcanobacter lacustris]
MAIFHSSAGIVSRSTGRTAQMAAAYITGKMIVDERTGEHKLYNKSHDIHSNILTPDNAPEWSKDTSTLWNYVEKFEDQIANYRFRGHSNELKNEKSMAAKLEYLNSAQTAQTLECSLPVELDPKFYRELIEDFLKERFVDRGLVVEYAIHFESGNPHFHAMMTRRAIDGNSLSESKDREIVAVSEIKATRKLYAEKTNYILEREGIEARVDHRSYKDMGLDIEPTLHKGWRGHDLERRGEYSRIATENEQIRQRNIEVIFNDPSQLIKDIALRKTVFTTDDLAGEIMRRVGGDEALFAILSEKVNQITIPNELGEIDRVNNSLELEKQLKKQPGNIVDVILNDKVISFINEIKTTDQAIANNNQDENKVTKIYEGIRTLEEQEKYFNQLDENAKTYASQILIDDTESVLVGSNIKSQLVYSARCEVEKEKQIFELCDKIYEGNDKKLDHNRVDHFISLKEREFKGKYSLSDEQRDAIHYLCDGSNIRSVVGRAGSGKTTLLKVVADSYKDGGYRVLGTSFQGKAVDIMAREIGIETRSLDSYLYRWKEYNQLSAKINNNELSGRSLSYAQNRLSNMEQYRFTKNDVIIVDEANMVGSRLLLPLFKEIANAGAKLITISDPMQIKTHDAGDISRGVISKYGAFEISNVLRQNISWQKEASAHLNEHNLIDGLKPYFDKGNVNWCHDSFDASSILIEDYLKDKALYPDQSQLILTFLNSKVEKINLAVHHALQEKGGLKDTYIIGGKAFSINERIVFTKNDNNGRAVKNIDDINNIKRDIKHDKDVREQAPSKQGIQNQAIGVKNGTFGNIIDIKQRNEVFELKVRLDDDRIVKFDTSTYKDFSYGYAITINKSEGESIDRSYILFDDKMNANLTLIAMTRHKQDVRAYIDGNQFIDFKDVVTKLGNSQKKELISDYTISDKIKPYYERVKSYRESGINASNLLEEMMSNSPANKELFQHKSWKDFQNNINIRNDYAKEILKDWDNHSLFVTQINVRKSTIEVHAGVRDRLLSDIEVKASNTVGKYFDTSNQTRNLWQEIKTTHPGWLGKSHPSYQNYEENRKERDSLASVIAESPTLYRQFFKVTYKDVEILNEDNVTKTERIKLDYFGIEIKGTHTRWATVTKQAEDHYKHELTIAKVDRLNPEDKEHYQIVKSYIQTRNNVVSYVANLKNTKNIFYFPKHESHALFKQEIASRDNLALKMVESPDKYERFFELFNINQDNLLDHAIRGEIAINRDKNKSREKKLEAGLEVTSIRKSSYDQKFDRRNSFYNFEAVKAESAYNSRSIALAVLGEPNRSLSSNSELRYGSKGSLSVKISGKSAGLWHDFESGVGGDIIKLISVNNNISYKDAIEYSASLIGMSPSSNVIKINSYELAKNNISIKNINKDNIESNKEAKRAEFINKLYEQSKAANGTIVEKYLTTHRNITTSLPDSIRFIDNHYEPGSKSKMPAMAVFARNKDGDITGVQVTYLNSTTYNKADISIKKRSYGSIKGSFVEIQKGNDNQPVYVTEGIENALSVKEAGAKGAILVSLGISNIKNIDSYLKDDEIKAVKEEKEIKETNNTQGQELKPQREIVICGDNDGINTAAGKSIHKSALHLVEQNYQVKMIMPETIGSDFNDILKQEGIDALKAYFKEDIIKDTISPIAESKSLTPTDNDLEIKDQTIRPILTKEEIQTITNEANEGKAYINEQKNLIKLYKSSDYQLGKYLQNIYGYINSDKVISHLESLPQNELVTYLEKIEKDPNIIGKFTGETNYLLFDDNTRKTAKELSLNLPQKMQEHYQTMIDKKSAEANIKEVLTNKTTQNDISNKSHEELSQIFLTSHIKEVILTSDYENYKPNIDKLELIATKMADYSILTNNMNQEIKLEDLENLKQTAAFEVVRKEDILKGLNRTSEYDLDYSASDILQVMQHNQLSNNSKAERLASIEAGYYKNHLANPQDNKVSSYAYKASNQYNDNLAKEDKLASEYLSQGLSEDHSKYLAKNIIILEEKLGHHTNNNQLQLIAALTEAQMNERNKILENTKEIIQQQNLNIPKEEITNNINYITENIGKSLMIKSLDINIMDNNITKDISKPVLPSEKEISAISNSSLDSFAKSIVNMNKENDKTIQMELELSKDRELDLDKDL